MVTKVLQLLLLIFPISVGARINMDAFDLIFFRTGIVVLFTASLLDTPKRQVPQYFNKVIVGLLGLCLLNIFINTFAPQVMAMTMNLFLAIMGIYIIYTYLDESKDLTRYILLAGLINVLFCIGQRIGFDPVFDDIPQNNPNLAGSFMGNNPRLANYLALSIPFLPLYLLPLSLLLVILTKQMVILIPVILILLIRLKRVKYKLWMILLGIVSAILLREHLARSFKTRMDVWFPTLQAFFDRPLIGYGFGTKIFPDKDAYFSSYLSIMIGSGVYGLIWLGYALKQIYKRVTLSNNWGIALITLLLVMLIEYPIEHMRLWYLIMTIIAISLIKSRKEEVV